MKQRWTLNVNDFGKIKKAEIEISPMMLFVGDNNSGKSYLMALLWGLFESWERIFTEYEIEPEVYDSYYKLNSWAEKLDDGQQDVIIDEAVSKLFVDWLNELLFDCKEDLVLDIFNHSIGIGELSINTYSRVIENDSVIEGYKFNNAALLKDSDEKDRWSIFAIMCKEMFFQFDETSDHFDEHRFMYLPASRTGFILSYKNLISNTVERSFSRADDLRTKKQKTTFMLPIIKFLQTLIKIESCKSAKYIDIANEMERDILLGEVLIDEAPIPNYYFKPTGTEDILPPYVTSSLVTELMPLVLVLKSQISYDLLVIEEPETHLHLKMQKYLAKGLVRLVNKDLPVWLTTHSDTIFQQVNNQIQLFNHPDRDKLANKFGYSKEDYLDPSKVRAYQFVVGDDGRTEVEALELSEYGFAVPTFNDPIYNLAKETLELQKIDEDDEE